MKSPRLWRGLAHFRSIERSVVHGDAGNVSALQGLANRFGLIALQSGEPRAVELAVAFRHHRLGEGVRLAEQAAGLIARRIDALLSFAFAFERADLNDPAGMGHGLDGQVVLSGRGRQKSLFGGRAAGCPAPASSL